MKPCLYSDHPLGMVIIGRCSLYRGKFHYQDNQVTYIQKVVLRDESKGFSSGHFSIEVV